MRLWWLWLQQRLREQLLLSSGSTPNGNRQTCRGVFPHGTFLRIKQVERKRKHAETYNSPLFQSHGREGRTRTYVRAVAAAMHTWAEK